MFRHHNPSSVRTTVSAVALALAACCASWHASAAEQVVSFSGPSTAQRLRPAVFTAAGLKPDTAVSVAVLSPGGGEAHYSAVASADGSLSYRLMARQPGAYQLKVLDASGKVLATTVVQVPQ